MNIPSWILFATALCFAVIGVAFHLMAVDDKAKSKLHRLFYIIAIIIAIWWLCRLVINAWGYFEQHPLLAIAIAIGLNAIATFVTKVKIVRG